MVNFNATPGLSFDEAKAILKNEKKKNSMEKAAATTATIAATAGTVYGINKLTKGKSFKINSSINKALKNFAKSETKFPGAKYIKGIAEKIGKTSPRQKLTAAALAVGALALMGVREHFSRKKGQIEGAEICTEQVEYASKFLKK